MKKGFTLIELLVAISIIAILSGLLLSNLNDARARARDANKKANLGQLKTALRLYYNDYQTYPAGNGSVIQGCGDSGTSNCPLTGPFQAGDPVIVYMKTLPGSDTTPLGYYMCTGGDDFRTILELENASDEEITTSQARCPNIGCTVGAITYQATDYIVCTD